MGRLAILVLLAGFSCALGQPAFSNVWDALGQLNCSRLQAAIDAAGLKATLQAPSLQVIFLAPTDAAFSSDEAVLAALFPSGPNNNLYYNMLPQAVPLGQFGATDGETVASQYPADPQATSSVTIRLLSPTTGDALAVGVAPGALFNTQRYYTAGQSTIYLLDNVLVPPSLRFLNPATGPRNLLGLTINQALTSPELQAYGIWTTLVAADPELTAYMSDQDQAATMFVPLNSAMLRYFACQGTTLPQFKGSLAAKALVLGHVLPGQPYSLRNFPASAQLPAKFAYVAVTSDGTGNAVTAGGKNVISDYSNIRAGKSILHIIDGVISNNPCINSIPSPIASGVVTAPPPAVAPPEDVASSSGGSDGPNLAMIGGVVAAGVIGLILIGVLIAFIVIRKRKNTQHQERERLTRGGSSRHQGSRRALDGHTQLYVNAPLYGRRGRSASARERASPAGGITKQPINVQGFMFGDQFVRCTAPQYSWIDIPAEKVVPGVEAGINDTALDASLTSSGNSPIIRLTRADVVKQIRLLNSGLLGRGASALVFKCQWPSRFGPNALLAIKVLKDPYEADPSVYESFCYEAAVLASVRHPNVVKMYGFCLELPTACIIMELCPGTLKDRLYRRVPGASSRSASATVTGAAPTAAPGPQARTGANLSPVTEAAAKANKGLIEELIANPLGKVPLDKVVPAHGSDPDAVALVAAAPGQLPLPQSDSANGAPQPTVTVSVSPPTSSAAPQRSRSAARSNVSLPHGLAANGDRPTSGPVNQGYPVQYNTLSMAEVLLLAADVAAGLAYLHRRPAIMALPMHPTLMLEAATGENGTDPLSATNSQTTVTHVGPAIATAAAEVDEDQGEEEDEGKAVARIVHRDLKPSNILVNSHSRCKISDFGLARWHSNTTVHTGTLGVGTLRYMAPELLLGHYSGRGPEADPVTNRVDIYSLGMLCYEMATSQMPWMDLTDAQIVAAVINQKRPNLEGQVSDAVEPEVDISDKDAIPALLKAQHIDEGTGRTPDLPDTLSNFPALISIINSCWQQQDGRRPTARMVHKALRALAVSYGQNPEAGAAGQGSS